MAFTRDHRWVSVVALVFEHKNNKMQKFFMPPFYFLFLNQNLFVQGRLFDRGTWRRQVHAKQGGIQNAVDLQGTLSILDFSILQHSLKKKMSKKYQPFFKFFQILFVLFLLFSTGTCFLRCFL